MHIHNVSNSLNNLAHTKKHQYLYCQGPSLQKENPNKATILEIISSLQIQCYNLFMEVLC